MSRISLTDWKITGQFFSYRNHRIFSRAEGQVDSPVLLLIHGFPTASWDWEAVWPKLARRYRVLTLDMIGFGFSAKPEAYDYSIIDQANIYESLLQRYQVQEYHILAHDYGDSVAQELLARQEEPGQRPQLRSVCFLNGGLFPETHRPVLVQKLLLSPLGPVLARLMGQAQFNRNMQKVFGRHSQPDASLLDSFWQLLMENDGRRVLPKLIGYMPERRKHRERWVGALQNTLIPLKLIDGMTDPISGAHMVARYKELVPKPNVTLLNDVGHYPQVEAPQAVLEAYLQFRVDLARAPKKKADRAKSA
jgi:pimeloyl-ACP methyl ester carboxylesterase